MTGGSVRGGVSGSSSDAAAIDPDVGDFGAFLGDGLRPYFVGELSLLLTGWTGEFGTMWFNDDSVENDFCSLVLTRDDGAVRRFFRERGS